MKKLDKRIRILWYIGYSILFIIVLVGYIVALCFSPLGAKEIFFIINVIGIFKY